ncbi:MAG: autotransporter outer membrane beta-barrel domain-containing protein, partial [Mollicutes bacterium]|nr:autotransporter outer membrane beta-barrel domain-containing protein [Mollicutes bacterium]
QQEVFSGGTATDTTINSGGQQIVSTGGIANNTTINGFIDSAGDIYSYGLQELYGTASATTINSGGQQVVNGGSASSSMINSSGEQIVYNSGTATGTTINGGEQNVNAGGSTTGTTINGGEQNVNADGSTTGTTINSGGKQNVYNSGSATNTTVHNGGWQTVRSGAIVTDTTINGGSVILINDGATLAGSTILNQGSIQAGLDNDLSYTIEDLTVTGGKIILSNVTPESINKTADRRLTIDKLTGAANFIIATDLAKGKADHITIASGGSVQHTLQIAYDPLYESDDTIDGVSVPFAAVPGSGIGFSAVATDYGAYRYTPTLAASPDGTVWSITGLDLSDSGLPEPSETCYTASDAATGSLMIWRQENNSLIRRMGELRNNPGESGDWVQVYKGEQEIANIGTRSTTQRYTAIQGGHDSKVDFWGRTWRAGYVVGYLDSDLSLAHGSGDATSLSIGGYAAWLGESGHFLDLIIKQGRLKTSYDSYLNDPDNTKVSGSYRNWGTSFSAEYGW